MSYRDVLDYWFADEPLGKEQMNRWWKKDPSVDEWIKSEFGGLVDQVYNGLCQSWGKSAEGMLAAIICLDQFPRNMYRETPKAFEYDHLALELTQEGLLKEYNDLTFELHKAFFLMPLMHHECSDSQSMCVKQFKKLAEHTSSPYREYFKGGAEFAVQHQVIIDRFGRFPHRNEILGRESSAEEIEFLKQPGSSF